jgi:hypothetical protein
MRTPYPGYDVLAKWDSQSFNAATREVLAARLAEPPPFRFFDADAARLLQAVVERLLPQPDRPEPIPLARWIDRYLFEGQDQGYRDARQPPRAEAWRRGLAGIAAEAERRFGTAFADLPSESQDEVLRAVQRGDTAAETWGDLDPRRFFGDDLLLLAAQLYYTHPDAWSEIGFGGPASPRGYVRMGFGERDPWEAKLKR